MKAGNEGPNMNLTTTNGLDLRIGSGLYHFRLSIDGLGVLVRVPLLGKAWAYAGGHSGRMGWAGVKVDHALGFGD